ncbi:MAG: hypothetical protein L6282_10655 [Candidatus Methanoperedenaceae archaeon]|nr:hypothetical protein [Candidatus Methanoperedenaceae archaeon]
MNILLTHSVINILTALGLRPQTPADAPPLAGFNKKSPVADNHKPQMKADERRFTETGTRMTRI